MVYLVSFMIFKINKEYVCEMSKNGTKKEKKIVDLERAMLGLSRSNVAAPKNE